MLAASPLAALGLIFASLVPPPAVSAPDRRIVLGDPAAFPGRAAVDPGRIGAPIDWARLPFDAVDAPASLSAALAAAGFAGAAGEGGLLRFTRPPRWTLLDEWASWKPTAWHADDPSTRLVCPFRFTNGAWGCGRGLQMIPEVTRLDGRVAGVVLFTPAAAGTHLEVEVALPTGAVGELIPHTVGQAPAITVRRGDVAHTTACEERCALLIPPGEGRVTLRIDGPNPAVYLDLAVPP